MKILACQFSKVSGPDAVSNYTITFNVDESQRRGVQSMLDFKKGTSLLLLLYEVDKDEKEIESLSSETPEQTRTRFNKRLHAIIKQIAKEKGVSTEKIKNALKEFLKNKKLIKESTKELDVNGLAKSIYYIQTEFQEDYEQED